MPSTAECFIRGRGIIFGVKRDMALFFLVKHDLLSIGELSFSIVKISELNN